MLIVETSWKKDVNEDSKFEKCNLDINDICETHGIQNDNVQYFNCISGVPMIDNRSQKLFNELVYTWIDEL